MLFLVLTDEGIEPVPLDEPDLATAANVIKQRYGLGTGQVKVAVVIPDDAGVINQDPTNAANTTITRTTDETNQATLLAKADQALAGNATFLALANPTTAQAVAQVKALTQQVDALIRLAAGDFSATT